MKHLKHLKDAVEIGLGLFGLGGIVVLCGVWVWIFGNLIIEIISGYHGGVP